MQKEANNDFWKAFVLHKIFLQIKFEQKVERKSFCKKKNQISECQKNGKAPFYARNFFLQLKYHKSQKCRETLISKVRLGKTEQRSFDDIENFSKKVAHGQHK